MSSTVQDALVVRKIDDTWFLRRVILDANAGGDHAGFQQAFPFESREQALQAAHAMDQAAPTAHGVLELNEQPDLAPMLN